MGRANPVVLFGFLVIVLVVIGTLEILTGALYIGKHEGDTLHLLQIVFRMEAGEWPHLDIMTPIGALAFVPIVIFLKSGAGIGHAIIYAQLLVGAVLLPAVWWVGINRLRGIWPYVFGFLVLTMVTALVFGLSEKAISISMHYNRWAWALAFLAITLAVLPENGKKHGVIDGGIIGICMVSLAMIKVTYFVGFAPAIVVAMLMRESYRALLVSIVIALAIVLTITYFSGTDFWRAYLADLLVVADSEVRLQPSKEMSGVIGTPQFLGGSMLVFSGVILLRQSGEKIGGLVLLLLAPGFFYVSYQNFGNDQKWLPLMAIMLIALRPAAHVANSWGWNMRAALNLAATGAFAIALPSILNLTFSSSRHYATDSSEYLPFLPRSKRHSDLRGFEVRVAHISGNSALDGPGSGLEHYAKLAKLDEVGQLFGEELPRCELVQGLNYWFDAIAQDLEKTGLTNGKRLLATDLLSSYWLYGDLKPLIGGAPWYYGGLPGIDSADFVLVPLCPLSMKLRKQMLDILAEREDIELREVHRTSLYILLEKLN